MSKIKDKIEKLKLDICKCGKNQNLPTLRVSHMLCEALEEVEKDYDELKTRMDEAGI